MFVDALLIATEEGVPVTGVYDEARGYSVAGGEPLVESALWQTATETRVGGESSDPDSWAATTTMTKVDRESDDTD